MTIAGSTVTGNRTNYGGIYNQGGEISVVHSIVTGNSGGDTRNIRRDCYIHSIIGTNMKGAAIADSYAEIINDNGTLPANSPAVDAGDASTYAQIWTTQYKGISPWDKLYNAGLVSSEHYNITGLSDILGSPRQQGEGIDIGAFERQAGEDVIVTVSFVASGGYETAPQALVAGNRAAMPLEPSRDGYIFTGWFTDASCTAVYNFNKAVTDNITLYPSWLATSWNPFSDVNEGDWYYDGVKFAHESGLTAGTSQTRFGPSEEMTNAMILALLWRLDGKPVSTYKTASIDLLPSWYYQAGLWALEQSIAISVHNDFFHPDIPITRMLLTKIMFNYASYLELDTCARTDLSGYTDAIWIYEEYIDAMQWAVAVGIIEGRSATELSPFENVTSGELCTILQRFNEYYIA